MTMISKISFGAMVAGSMAVPAGAVTTVTLNLVNNSANSGPITIGGNGLAQYSYNTTSDGFKRSAQFFGSADGYWGNLMSDTGAPVALPSLGTATNNGALSIGNSKSPDVSRYLPLEFKINGATQVGNAFFDGNHGLSRIEYAAAVPEPAVWVELVAGFGLAGAAMRRRRPQAALVA